MQRSLILVVLALCGAAVAMMWWQSTEHDATVPVVSDTDHVDGKPSKATADLASDSAETAAFVSAEVPEELFRTEAEAGEEIRFLTIQVWDRKKGVPAAKAEVFVLDAMDEDVDWSFTEGLFKEHWSSVAEREGRRFRTTDQGRVDVPEVRGNAVIAARLPGAYAYRWIGEERNEKRAKQREQGKEQVEVLTLRDDRSVKIRVVDGRGQPVADAAVGIIERIPIPPSKEAAGKVRDLEVILRDVQQWMRANPESAGDARDKLNKLRRDLGKARREADAAKKVERKTAKRRVPPTRVEVRVRRRTDENGIAVVEHFQLYQKRPKRGASKQSSKGKGKGGWKPSPPVETTFEAALLMPLAQPVTKALAKEEVVEQTVELIKPPTASLSLHTVDRDGRPFAHPVHGQLRMAGKNPAGWALLRLRKEHGEYSIEFPHVGLGLTYLASCRLDDDDFRWRSPEFVGPVAEGERFEADLVVAPDAGMLYGRLVDREGGPLAEVEPTFLISAVTGRLEGEEVITDADGRFHLPYKVRERQRPPYRLEVRLQDEPPTKGIAMPIARLPLATVTDLGELRIDAFGAFAEGVVVNDIGEPIEGAELQLERQRPVGRNGSLRFTEEAFVHAESDEQGRFQLFGALEAGNYRLHVEAENHFERFVVVGGGARSVRAEMLRKSRVVGTVLAPEWMKRDRVRVELKPVAVNVPAGEKTRQREDQLRDYRGKTYAYFDWVRAGTYDVTFRLQGFPDPFLRIDSLAIEAGQTGMHPRLTNLDLGSYLYRFEIHPVDENGQAVGVNRPQLARVTRPNGEQTFVGLVMKGRKGEVFNTRPQLEVFPSMAGYFAEPQVLAAGNSQLVFRRVPPVELVFGGLSALAGDVPVQVVLELINRNGRPDRLESFDTMSRRIAGWYAKSRYTSTRLNGSDVGTVRVTAGGPHRVVLRFGVGRTKPETVALPAIDVKVVPGGTPPRISVPFDSAVVQQAVQAVLQRMQNK